MSHPYHEHRQSKKEHSRVGHITKGYASGGAIPNDHPDEKADIKLIKAKVKKTSLKAEGGKVKHRADKRARGGRTNKKKGMTVNIINSPGHAMGGAPMAGGPMPPGGAMPMPPHPPMGAAPPPGSGAPPMPPGASPMPPGGSPMPPRPGMMPPPGAMPMRAAGGRVKDGPAWNTGLKAGTQVQHSDGKTDGKNIGRGKVVTFRTGGGVGQTSGTAGPGMSYTPTYKRTKEPMASDVKRAHGGKIEAPEGVEPATKLPGGSGGARARLAKEHRAERDYAKA